MVQVIFLQKKRKKIEGLEEGLQILFNWKITVERFFLSCCRNGNCVSCYDSFNKKGSGRREGRLVGVVTRTLYVLS